MDEILLLTPFRISFQLKPFLTPIIAANEAASNSANWLAPPKALSPYKKTFNDSSPIRKIIGINALTNDCCFMIGVNLCKYTNPYEGNNSN